MRLSHGDFMFVDQVSDPVAPTYTPRVSLSGV
jgi:hypothetical protein